MLPNGPDILDVGPNPVIFFCLPNERAPALSLSWERRETWLTRGYFMQITPTFAEAWRRRRLFVPHKDDKVVKVSSPWLDHLAGRWLGTWLKGLKGERKTTYPLLDCTCSRGKTERPKRVGSKTLQVHVAWRVGELGSDTWWRQP